MHTESAVKPAEEQKEAAAVEAPVAEKAAEAAPAPAVDTSVADKVAAGPCV